MSAKITVALASAQRRTQARPKPDAPPVIRIAFSESQVSEIEPGNSRRGDCRVWDMVVEDGEGPREVEEDAIAGWSEVLW